MKKLGLISEFNPFHNGHKYLLDKCKQELNIDFAISIMSGDFVQRGEASIIDKYKRAYVAIKCGFDLVVEMPNFVSLQAAELFALKSVTILDKMNIDYLVFGIENMEPADFLGCTKIIMENKNEIDYKTKSYLKAGFSYPKSHNMAIENFVTSDFISSNNILALEYIKAINKIGSRMMPYPIKRIKTQNKDLTIKDNIFASSTAIRNNIDIGIKSLMPDVSYDSLIKFRMENKVFNEDFIYNIFKYKILIENSPMSEILGYEEGIDNYLKKLSMTSKTYREFLDKASSQRYTRSRLKRLVLNYILNNTNSLNKIDISFIKVLAYNSLAADVFKSFPANLDIIINKKDAKKLNSANMIIYENMINSSNLYSIGFDRGMNLDFKHNNRPID